MKPIIAVVLMSPFLVMVGLALKAAWKNAELKLLIESIGLTFAVCGSVAAFVYGLTLLLS